MQVATLAGKIVREREDVRRNEGKCADGKIPRYRGYFPPFLGSKYPMEYEGGGRRDIALMVYGQALFCIYVPVNFTKLCLDCPG